MSGIQFLQLFVCQKELAQLIKENCFLFMQWKLVTSQLKVSCICVQLYSTPCSFLSHAAGWSLFYTILGRTMKLALRVVIQITFPSLFLRILNPGLRRQDNTAKALKSLYSLRFDGLKKVCLLYKPFLPTHSPGLWSAVSWNKAKIVRARCTKRLH